MQWRSMPLNVSRVYPFHVGPYCRCLDFKKLGRSNSPYLEPWDSSRTRCHIFVSRYDVKHEAIFRTLGVELALFPTNFKSLHQARFITRRTWDAFETYPIVYPRDVIKKYCLLMGYLFFYIENSHNFITSKQTDECPVWKSNSCVHR